MRGPCTLYSARVCFMTVVEFHVNSSVGCGLGCCHEGVCWKWKQFVRAADICVWSLSMNELASLISSRGRQKTKEPDFGTYHHSTLPSRHDKRYREVVRINWNNWFATRLTLIDDNNRSTFRDLHFCVEFRMRSYQIEMLKCRPFPPVTTTFQHR